MLSYMLSFSAFAGKHLTIVRAGLAFTTYSLPNAIFFPAFVAGLTRVLIMHTPGKTNFPVLPTSLVTSSESTLKTFEASDFFISHFSATAASTAVLDMAFAFLAFIGAILTKWS